MNYKEKALEFFSKDIFATEATGIVIDEVEEKTGKSRQEWRLLEYQTGPI